MATTPFSKICDLHWELPIFCLVIVRTTRTREKALAARVDSAFAAFARVGPSKVNSWCENQFSNRIFQIWFNWKSSLKQMSQVQETSYQVSNSLPSQWWTKQATPVEVTAIPAKKVAQLKLLLQSVADRKLACDTSVNYDKALWGQVDFYWPTNNYGNSRRAFKQWLGRRGAKDKAGQKMNLLPKKDPGKQKYSGQQSGFCNEETRSSNLRPAATEKRVNDLLNKNPANKVSHSA